MTVELINHNSGGILDLTGGASSAPVEEPVLDLTNDPKSVDTVGQTTVTDTVTEPVVEGAEQTAEQPATPPVEDVSADTAATEPELFFGEEKVTVEVPEEISNALTEAGIDQNELLSQLFKKGGDFNIEGELREKLEAKFGKLMVDGYLNMYRGINQQSIEARAKAQADQSATEQQHATEYVEAVGGAEGLAKMESFIVQNFDDKQIAAYNAVMESGDHASQMLIIGTVRQQMVLADKLANGDTNIKLIGDDSSSAVAASPLDKGYLTSAEYNEFMDSDKYWTDQTFMQRVDAARTAGIRKGI